ncbi:MAG: alpha/beta fold hydrolase [Halieaceae bacterium]|nr:alpha/beta fold hydrolase [Halieaceae bacterium]
MRAVLLLMALLAAPAQADCVILLHGLARTAGSMEPLAAFLSERDYRVVNVDYPSRHYRIEELADVAVPAALDDCEEATRVHFVTHSMGGILVRQFLAHHQLNSLGRVVMLGPPNQGSEVVDKLGTMPGFEWLNGEAGLQLGTGADSLPRTLGPADFDLGIIAGTASINPMLSTVIPGDDDGKVSVERARLEGMNDFITVPATHTFLMQNREVMRQVAHYLEHGTFLHQPD